MLTPTTRTTPPPTRTDLVGRLRARADDRLADAALRRALAEHIGAAARRPENLQERPCPVCGEPPPAAGALPLLRAPVYEFHRCRGCGILFAPRVLRHDVTRRLYAERPIYRTYWDRMRADAEAARGRRLHDALVERIAAAAPARAVVIDVGCGFGQLVAELATRFDEAIGLELNRRTAAAARELNGVSVLPVRLERLDRPAESVDAIVLNQVLEHLTDVRSVVEAARRLLRPGGVLHVGIPHGASLGLRVLGPAHPQVATHMHVNLFTAGSLRRLATEGGFEVRSLATTDGLDLGAGDLVVERLPARAPLLLPPALAIDAVLRRAAALSRWPSRLGVGAHLEALLVKPRRGSGA